MIRNAKVFGYQLCSFLSEISNLTPCAQEHQLGILQQLEQHVRLEAGPSFSRVFHVAVGDDDDDDDGDDDDC